MVPASDTRKGHVALLEDSLYDTTTNGSCGFGNLTSCPIKGEVPLRIMVNRVPSRKDSDAVVAEVLCFFFVGVSASGVKV